MSGESKSSKEKGNAMRLHNDNPTKTERPKENGTSGSTASAALATTDVTSSRNVGWLESLRRVFSGSSLEKQREELKQDFQAYALATARQMELDRQNHELKMRQLAFVQQKVTQEHEKNMHQLDRDIENDRQKHALRMEHLKAVDRTGDCKLGRFADVENQQHQPPYEEMENGRQQAEGITDDPKLGLVSDIQKDHQPPYEENMHRFPVDGRGTLFSDTQDYESHQRTDHGTK